MVTMIAKQIAIITMTMEAKPSRNNSNNNGYNNIV